MTGALEETADLAKSVATLVSSARTIRDGLKRRQPEGCRCGVCRETIADLQEAVSRITDALDLIASALTEAGNTLDIGSRVAMRADRVASRLATELLPTMTADAAARVRADWSDPEMVELAQHRLREEPDE